MQSSTGAYILLHFVFYKNNMGWIELCLLLGWGVPRIACHESSNAVAPQSTPTPPQGTVKNADATSSSVAFTTTILFLPDYRINVCTLYKSWGEKQKSIKEKVKITYNQGITAIWIFSVCLEMFLLGRCGQRVAPLTPRPDTLPASAALAGDLRHSPWSLGFRKLSGWDLMRHLLGCPGWIPAKALRVWGSQL